MSLISCMIGLFSWQNFNANIVENKGICCFRGWMWSQADCLLCTCHPPLTDQAIIMAAKAKTPTFPIAAIVEKYLIFGQYAGISPFRIAPPSEGTCLSCHFSSLKVSFLF